MSTPFGNKPVLPARNSLEIPAILNGYRRTLFVRLIANGFAQAVVAVGTAWLVKEIFDRFLTPEHPILNTDMTWLATGLVATAACIGGLRMMERIDAERMGQSYASEVRIVLYDCLSSLAPHVLQKRSRGGVSLRFVGDMTSLRRWVSLGLARVTVAGISTVMALLALAIMNWQLAVVVAAGLSLGTGVAYAFGKRLRATSRESRRRLSNLAANVNEKVTSIAVVQVFGQIDRERAHIIRQGQHLHDSMIVRARVAGQILGITEFSAAITSATALVTGVFIVAANQGGTGTVIAAMTIVGILMPPLRDLGRIHEYWHGAFVAREKLKEFLDTPSLVTQAANAPDLKPGAGRLEFNSISVAGSLDRVSAVVEPGSVVVLVGPNGAGKSTLLSVAARLIDPDEGTILLDGQDLASHRLDSVRRAIGMAGPDLPLLRGTVDRNLRYRWRDAPVEEIARVRSLCGVDEVLAQLPQGDKTRIAEGGMGLSAGQRQRIALARALLGDPTLLLLDEVDTNLDPRASTVIDRVLAEHRGTVLLVTHHLKHIAAADVIWYLEGGHLVEMGPPDKVLAGTGPIAHFFGNEKVMVR
ncbi:ABC transporter ATP-binding protein [Nitrosospira lacus]|uniref:ABC transporter n=1 Tax=Nitrosospira lacus TaxID=1288494 RepID=A0A1W6SSM9_9PROT|nr:ABC transporter ATP-binding protein [Nitrosospira lacus]ARO88789.1 ABC transporter ATP-binding protein [Nitrosospira lacus]